MPSRPSTASEASAPTHPIGSVTLVTGPEELLNERVVEAARNAVRRADPEAEVSATVGDQLTMASLGELAAPSLFSTTRCVIVRQLEDTPEDAHEGLLGYAAAPDSDVALVLVHTGGQKGAGLLARLRKLGPVHEHRSEKCKGAAVARFAESEVRRHGGRIEPDALEVLVEAVGDDLRGLAAAADQLCHDFPDQPLSTSVVRKYFVGRADVKGYEIAEHVLRGRTAEAMEELRWALQTGASGPMITGSFASSVRSLARFHGARRGLREADLAREVGVPPFRIRHLREQAKHWDEAGLVTAIRAVAQADAEVKGAGADLGYNLERMILTIAGARLQR